MAHALCIGNFTVDLTEHGEAPGGSVLYSGATFAALGMQPRIVAAAGPDLSLDAVRGSFEFRLSLREARRSTSMRNTYTQGVRAQVLSEAGEPIRLQDVPAGWADGAIVLLCPVFGEVSQEITRAVRGEVTGVSLQGWLRRADRASRIVGSSDVAFLADLRGTDVLFFSDEDVVHDRELIGAFVEAAPILVHTHGPSGATVTAGGRTARIEGFAAPEVDPTGAGDTFAAAFLTHYHTIRDPFAAARFGCLLASVVVRVTGPLTPEVLGEYEDLLSGELGVLRSMKGP